MDSIDGASFATPGDALAAVEKLVEAGLPGAIAALQHVLATDAAADSAKRLIPLQAAIQMLPEGATVDILCTPQAAQTVVSAELAERALEPLTQACAVAPNSELLNLAFARALIEARRFEAAVRVLRLVECERRMGRSIALPAQDITFACQWATTAAAGEAVPAKLAGTGTATVDNSQPSSTTITIHPPVLPSLACLLALAQARAGDLPAAQTTLHTAVQGDPDGTTQDGKGAGPMLKAIRLITDARDRGNEAYKAGKHDEALQAYGEGQETAKKRLGTALSFFHSNAAAALMAQNKHEDALNECLAALRAYPSNTKAWSRAATCLSSIKPINHEAVAAATAALQYLQPEEAASNGRALLAARTKAGDDSVDGHSASVMAGLTGMVRPMFHPKDDGEYQKVLTDWRAGKGKKSAGRITPIFTGDGPGPADLGSARLQIVDFFATWCGPCKQIAPLFSQLAAGTAPVSFVKVDGDLCKASASGMNAPPAKGSNSGSDGACKPAGGQCCGGGGCGSGAANGPQAGGAVRAFPTFAVFLDGEELDRMEGADPGRLSSMIKDGLQAWMACPPRPGHVKLPGQHGTTTPPPALQEAVLSKDCRAEITMPLSRALRTLGVV